jgi:tellurite resistance protein
MKTGRTVGLTLDQAFIGLLIAAMDANRHVSSEEAARAHHIIWSMKRFRRKSGETVGRLIEKMRVYVGVHGSAATIDAACQVIPRELRPAAFALSADLVLADGRIEPAEQRFLAALADRLGLTAAARNRLREAMLVKIGA